MLAASVCGRRTLPAGSRWGVSSRSVSVSIGQSISDVRGRPIRRCGRRMRTECLSVRRIRPWPLPSHGDECQFHIRGRAGTASAFAAGLYVVVRGKPGYVPSNANGIPCQRVADAIRSCVGHVMPERLEQAASRAFAEGLVTDEELQDIRRDIAYVG